MSSPKLPIYSLVQNRIPRREHDLGSGEGHGEVARTPGYREVACLRGLMGEPFACIRVVGVELKVMNVPARGRRFLSLTLR